MLRGPAFFIVGLLVIEIGPVSYFASDEPAFARRTKLLIRLFAFTWTALAIFGPIVIVGVALFRLFHPGPNDGPL